MKHAKNVTEKIRGLVIVREAMEGNRVKKKYLLEKSWLYLVTIFKAIGAIVIWVRYECICFFSVYNFTPKYKPSELKLVIIYPLKYTFATKKF